MVLRRERSTAHVYLLIALLCSIAGAVDCVAYFRLGHLFVANLTGNTVLFAYSAAQQHWAAAAQRLGLILAFFLGVVTNRTMQRWIQAENKTLNPAVVSLAIECSLLCVLAFFSSDGDLRIVLLLCAAISLRRSTARIRWAPTQNARSRSRVPPCNPPGYSRPDSAPTARHVAAR